MQMLGGWLDQALVDQRWIIIGQRAGAGNHGIRDIHIAPQEERTKVFRVNRFFSMWARRMLLK